MRATIGKLRQLHLSKISISVLPQRLLCKRGRASVGGQAAFLPFSKSGQRVSIHPPPPPMALKLSRFFRTARQRALTEGRKVHTLKDASFRAMLLGRSNTDLLPQINPTAPCETRKMPAPLLFRFLTFFISPGYLFIYLFTVQRVRFKKKKKESLAHFQSAL